MKRKYIERVLILTFVLAAICAATGVGVATAFAQEHGPGLTVPQIGAATLRWDICMAIAVAIGIPCLAAGYAVGKVGAAALGAASEKPELLTRSLVFVALGEGIAIFGFMVAILLYVKL